MTPPRRLLRLSRWIVDSVARLLLGPQVPVPPAARSHPPDALVQLTGELNDAAERYFADYRANEYLLGKPYSDPLSFSRYLFNVGVLLHRLRVGPGDLVLELGAGSCWVSHFLNLYGCRTVSVDVSASALELGRKVFERDARTNWHLEPRFLTYDGHTLPLDDESCDGIVLHDAFHHIPNQEEILREMHRVLRRHRVVAMEEPGRAHSLAETSIEEAETGVLENDIVVEELARLARSCGFHRTTVLPISLTETPEVAAEDLIDLVRGKGLSDHWIGLCRGAMASHFILLYKDDPLPTTRQPGRLAATIEVLGTGSGEIRVATGEPARLSCRITNGGDTLWLLGTEGLPGQTRLGARLQRSDDAELEDWARGTLDRDLEPGGRAEVEIVLPPLDRPGTYRVVLDLVAEQIAWFADRGSTPATLTLVVE